MRNTSSDRRTNDRAYKLLPTFIKLKDHDFKVNDISKVGIGILLEKDGPQFFSGERIGDIPISLESGTIYLDGKVSHISINEKGTICGIRFLFKGDDFKLVIQFQKERILVDN